MAGSQIDNQLLLLSYDNNSKTTQLSLLDENGDILRQKSFSIGIGDGVEEPIIDHFTRIGRQFPFKTGQTADGLYYFNGFYNYTFSLVFTDLEKDDPFDVVQGQQDDGGISTVLPLTGQIFVVARFNFGDNIVISHVQIRTSGITSSTDLSGNSTLEWIPDAHKNIRRIQSTDLDLVIYGSTTQNGHIMITAYDAGSGEWLRNKYLGYSTPYSLQQLYTSMDGKWSFWVQ